MPIGLIIFIVLMVVFSFFCFYMAIKMGNRNVERGLTWAGQKPVQKRDNGDLSEDLNKVKNLCDKREYYLDKYKNDVEYEKLSRAFNELATAYNRWTIEILGTPQLGKKPMNPYVAGGIGYGVGGIVGGVAMGVTAQNEQNKYEERLALFNKQLASINSQGDKAMFIYDEINSIINRSVIPKETVNDSLIVNEDIKEVPSTDDTYENIIIQYLKSNSPALTSEILLNNVELQGLSIQKVSAICRKLVKEDVIRVSKDKGKTLYSL